MKGKDEKRGRKGEGVEKSDIDKGSLGEV